MILFTYLLIYLLIVSYTVNTESGAGWSQVKDRSKRLSQCSWK